MAKRNWKLEIGGKGSCEIYGVNINGSVKYNFSKEEGQLDLITSIGNLGIKRRQKNWGLDCQLPDSLRKYVFMGGISIGVLAGMMSYLANPNPDFYYKIGEAITLTTALFLGSFYAKGKLSKRVKII